MIFTDFPIDKQFDVPDRTFHAIETTWNLSSFASAPDVKELIPEFFFLPEFLQNSEGRKWLGTRLHVELSAVYLCTSYNYNLPIFFYLYPSQPFHPCFRD